MYFETRIHSLLPVSSAEEAANLIKGGSVMAYQVPCWKSSCDPTMTIFAVPDGFNDSLEELAILRKADNGIKYSFVESLTNAWMTADQLKSSLKECEITEVLGETNLIVGKASGQETAWFTCGCCGSNFKGNVSEQLSFDQDAGYGICQSCEHFYK